MKNTKPSRSRVALDESHLCQFPYADGRQCRMSRKPGHPSLCLFHTREEEQLAELDRIGDELASFSGEFKTATDINHVIGKLFKLVAANRIPPRNAKVLSYLAQLLLQSQKTVRNEITTTYGNDTWRQNIHRAYRAPLPSPDETK